MIVFRFPHRNLYMYDTSSFSFQVIPLLNVHRTEEELTAANEEIEALKQKSSKIEKERNSLQERNDFLESKLTEITTDLQVKNCSWLV